MPGPLGGQTITIVKPTDLTSSNATDGYGIPLAGDTAPSPQRIVVPGCMLQPFTGPRGSSETNTSDSDLTMTHWHLMIPLPQPAGFSIASEDKVEADGLIDLQVDGKPVVWPDLQGVPDHIESFLKEWAG